jgi:hypothetical protein
MEAQYIKIEPQEEDGAEKQDQEQPPKKVTKRKGGQKREYNILKSVDSVDELHKIRKNVI